MDSRDLQPSGWVKFLRGFAHAYAVIGFVGGIVLAVNLGRAAGVVVGWGAAQRVEMAWGVFFIALIAYWLSTALIVALLMVYTENSINIHWTKLYARQTALKLESMAETSNSPTQAENPSDSPVNWRCSCGVQNTGATRLCKSCGKYR